MNEIAVFRALLDARTKRGKPCFEGFMVQAADLRKAEIRLDRQLPEFYKAFITRCGSGALRDELRFLSPVELTLLEFDYPWLEAIWFAEDDLGNRLAFQSPDKRSGKQTEVYYFCHDPAGYAKLASSFEEFLELLKANGFHYHELVENVEGFVELEYPQPTKGKPWWRFW